MSDITQIQLTYDESIRQANALHEVATRMRAQQRQVQEAVDSLARGGWKGASAHDYCKRLYEKAQQIGACADETEKVAQGIEETAKLVRQALGEAQGAGAAKS